MQIFYIEVTLENTRKKSETIPERNDIANAGLTSDKWVRENKYASLKLMLGAK